MMLKQYLFLVFFVGIFFSSKAQSDNATLIKIGNKKITKGEFLRIYNKNNSDKETDNVKNMEEYLDLFVNFKLKVIEAENQKLDTVPKFKRELKSYNKQLAKPYLVDNSIIDDLVKEAYDRMKYEVKASHILIKLTPDALPQDTLKAYNQIVEIRKDILGGKSFKEMARAKSDCPSGKKAGGDLGYFGAFRMVYSFETASYITDVDKISMPIRTQFGYHLIKVTERRKARGQIRVAHIMVAVPRGTKKEDAKKAKDKVYKIYDKLKKGEDFAKLAAEYSDDPGSAKKGGQLAWFGSGRMIPEFENAAFGIKKDGEFSEPVKTSYGWHIIKRMEHKSLASFKDLEKEIITKVKRDSRSQKSKDAVLEKIKKQYKFKEYKENLKEYNTVVDSSIFLMKWDEEKAKHLTKKIFQIGDSIITQKEFTKYISSKGKQRPMSIEKYINNSYKDYSKRIILEYKELHLAEENDDFKYLMQEYHDGILLFDLTDKMVWTKAVKDTVGLKKYYGANKEKYKWNTRYNSIIFSCKDEKSMNEAMEILKDKNKIFTPADIEKKINTTEKRIWVKDQGVFAKGDSRDMDKFYESIKDIDMVLKDPNVFTIKGDNIVIYNKKRLSAGYKTLKEAKGLVTADYQNTLEKEWIEKLRSKYKVKLVKRVWKKMLKNQKNKK